METRPVQETDEGQIDKLNEIIHILENEIERLRNERDDFKALLEAANKKYEKLIHEQKERIETLESEKNQLSKSIAVLKYDLQQLKNTYLQQLQRDGRVCSRDCVLCVIVWICRNKLDELSAPYCGPLLENIIILEEAKNITNKDLKCGKFMRMLTKCKIITNFKVVYHVSHKEKKFEMLQETWNTLKRNKERVCILATMKADGVGHALVLDVEKVKIFDPQNGRTVYMSEDFFKGLTALTVFSLNLERLKQIIQKHEEILHLTNELDTQQLSNGTLPMDI